MAGKNWIVASAWLMVGFMSPSATEVSAADVIVVCPELFREALVPWVQHRRDEGLTIDIIGSHANIHALRRSLKQTADDTTGYVVLVGDAPTIGTLCDPSRQVPATYLPTNVTAAWGSTPTLLSDMLLGDFDGDSLPDAVVGRLPVDRPDQLHKLVKRIIAQDNSTDFGPWRGNVQLTGGVGGFGALADATIESVTRTVVTNVLPLETRTSVIYASPGHAFCPVNDSFTDAVLRRYGRGSRFWVYAGHGQITELDRVPPSADGVPVLDAESVKRLTCPVGRAPIAVMLACYTGAIDAPRDSLAEQMLFADGGPIAVFAGSRVTMPYGNTTAAIGLIEGVFGDKLPRLGDAWLSALRQMHQESVPQNSNTRVMIDALASIISPAGTSLVAERREHMGLYNLLGDPTLRMHQPLPLVVQVAAAHDPGQPITLEIKSPIDGRLTVTFDKPLGGVTEGDPNQTTVASMETMVENDRVSQPRMVLPANISGPIIIRAIVSGEKSWATAAVRTLLRIPSR